MAEADSSVASLSVDGIRTALHCPRRYEFAHVDGLEGRDDEGTVEERVDLLRTALCDGLRSGETNREGLETVARDRLASLWSDHDERFHSVAQRRHERRVLEATVDAYVHHVGTDHAAGIERLAAATPRDELTGPGLSLSSTIDLTEPGETARTTETDPAAETVTIDATVDYVTSDGSSIVGVRFVPTLAPLGHLRYRSDWDGDVATRFTDHFAGETDVFEPDPVGALFETAVVLDGLRGFRERHDLADRTCRYVQVPLADRSTLSVNWIQNAVETSLEVVDLTDVYVDHHTFGMTHDHRNETVDSRLASVAATLVSESFDPAGRWAEIEANACPNCGYTVCCQEYLAREVRFDG
ncbi:PD-(D/E)XK nuclease family protein [Natrinema caseinilyticum]|uniref:PD-(D/E)XK nuclease family protein n=1 Tax=Natrinema caseinilyticum TaxID=2961570 RepID=UPI0020C4E405|nr:PD-(D/E)XK nuclease family protein [Natrinema caseinilyticum]